MGRLHEGFDKLTEALAEAAQAIWGSRLKALAVFGSVGRGTPRFDSDLDVLVVLSDLPCGRSARAEVGQALEESLSPVMKKLEQDGIFTELSLVLKSPEELKAGFPLLLDMVDDAKVLYDPEQLLANRLQAVRHKLEQAGAKRIWRANSWHWDVKGGRFQP